MAWNNRNTLWQSLDPYQRAAAMAMMEANAGPNYLRDSANVLGAIINRSEASKTPLGEHVNSASTYQPLIESGQEARLRSIVSKPEFERMTALARQRSEGVVPDWVGGATHYLAPAKTMVKLEQAEPNKYRDWGPRGSNWSTYDPALGDYRDKVMQDSSHAFLRPQEFGGVTSASKPTQTPDISDPAVTMRTYGMSGVTSAPSIGAMASPDGVDNMFDIGGIAPASAGAQSPAIDVPKMLQDANWARDTASGGNGLAAAGSWGNTLGTNNSADSGLGGMFSGMFGGDALGGASTSGGDLGGGGIGGMLSGIGQALGGGGGGGGEKMDMSDSPMIGNMRRPQFDMARVAKAIQNNPQLGSILFRGGQA